MTIGTLIRTHRLEKHLTQAQLAQHLGVSRQTIIHLEQGKLSPSFELMARLRELLAISLDAAAETFGSREPGWHWWPKEPAHSGPVVSAVIQGRMIVAPALETLTQDFSNGWWDDKSGQIRWVDSLSPLTQIFVAGCDPFLPWLARAFGAAEAPYRVIPFSLSSTKAVAALEAGYVHLAGSHLFDPPTGRYNQLAGRGGPWAYIGYLDWEEGRVFHPRTGKSGGWFLREPGSEAYALWRRQELEGRPIRHWSSHLQLIEALAREDGAQGVSLGSLAALYGLAFEPWSAESYEWVCAPGDLDTPWLDAFLRVLRSSPLSRQLSPILHQSQARWAQVRQD